MKKLAILISGSGRNLRAILQAISANTLAMQPVVVMSNRQDAGGLAFAQAANIPICVIEHQNYPNRTAFDAELHRVLSAYAPDVIALAGFMRILTPEFVQKWQGKMLNIHPSLLPKYTGLHTHQRALADRATEHGASIHFVTPELDGGPVILQGKITLTDFYAAHQDKPPELQAQILANLILEKIELNIYPKVLSELAEHKFALKNNQIYAQNGLCLSPKILDFT